jgi:ankyrin repeat protein
MRSGACFTLFSSLVLPMTPPTHTLSLSHSFTPFPPQVIRLLARAGASLLPNESGNLPLHWAVQQGDASLVTTLLDEFPNADVLAKNSFGKSVTTEVPSCPFRYPDRDPNMSSASCHPHFALSSSTL